MQQSDFAITSIAPARLPTPLRYAGNDAGAPVRYRSDADRVCVHATFTDGGRQPGELTFERAGPREHILFAPAKTTAAIVTCGGLCPGLNDVIRAVVNSLVQGYGVRRVLGIRFGYAGLTDVEIAPIELGPKEVLDIHKDGGTMLGSSRGFPSMDEVLDGITGLGIDILFVIGGDGTQRGGHAIHRAAQERGMRLAVVGIPKTIDNDIPWLDQTFGFDTAVAEAASVVDCAHVEARSARQGIGLVKLMGRDAGFIAAHAALASSDVDVALVPELPVQLAGEYGLFRHVADLLRWQGHALLVVAEGTSKHLFTDATERCDASGNKIRQDVGPYIKSELIREFPAATVKYIDPSYTIRSAPANAADSVLCARLGQCAVHAAMAGKSDMLVGRWYGKFTHVPLGLIDGQRKTINPASSLWRAVLEATGQPCLVPPSSIDGDEATVDAPRPPGTTGPEDA